MNEIRRRALLPRLAAFGLLGLAPLGCAATPSARLADARAQMQALREENIRWRDQVASLKARQRDIAERSVDDARRIAALEEANGRLEQSIGGYQKERDELEAAVSQFKARVLSAADSSTVPR